MEIVKLYRGTTLGGCKTIFVNSDDAFDLWCQHYNYYLQELYLLFEKTSCQQNLDLNISYDRFIEFVYYNSSPYLSPWL